jgi:hypothetical protein
MSGLRIKYLVLMLLIITINLGCEDPVSSPQEIPVEKLLSAPDTIDIEGEKIILNTYLWRDFMPVSPPDGKPLIALLMIESVDSSDISGFINPEAVYVVNGNEVWSSFFEDEIPPDNSPFRLTRIARDGPKWGPGIFVDVIVLLNVGRDKKLLRASDQYINRTD